MKKNQIILNGIVHKFIQDKPSQDYCWKCSLKHICDTKLTIDSNLCNIFITDKVENGHFELNN